MTVAEARAAVERILALCDPDAPRCLDPTAELHRLRHLSEVCCRELPAVAALLGRLAALDALALAAWDAG